MVSFLFIISFLLHIVTIASIFQLLRQRTQTNAEQQPRDMSALMETYLQEIKEENDRLQELIRRKESSLHTTPKEKVEPAQEEAQTVYDSNESRIEKDVPAYSPPAPIEEDHVEASLQSRILQLHHAGSNITEIAKQLNCGKTEVELIIKLHAKNGE